MTVEELFLSRGGEEIRFSHLGRILADLFQTTPEKVHVFSVEDAGPEQERELSVWFAAHGSPYYKAEKLHGYVAANKAKVTSTKSTINTPTFHHMQFYPHFTFRFRSLQTVFSNNNMLFLTPKVTDLASPLASSYLN